MGQRNLDLQSMLAQIGTCIPKTTISEKTILFPSKTFPFPLSYTAPICLSPTRL
ncbi:hypothetical protein SPHS6_01720 [Sphingobium sp. S6]|nr:hypothetical protein SPHS6_01720 [Sphingobium sp. S6]CAD7338981.1 hypothetical protein SPHS8_02392 [Sphingobium sp. S8]